MKKCLKCSTSVKSVYHIDGKTCNIKWNLKCVHVENTPLSATSNNTWLYSERNSNSIEELISFRYPNHYYVPETL